MYYEISKSNELYHHGIKGMKWGIRRYQNQDGTLTAEGKRKYGKSTGKSSNYRTKLENKYKSMGMTASQARYQADRNIKIKKILAVTAGVTISAAAVYAGTKIAKEYCDRTIKSGKMFQRISKSAIQNTKHNFYAANNPLDKLKYRGMYGGFELKDLHNAEDVYNHKIKIDKDIKLASINSARNVFKDLVKEGKLDSSTYYNNMGLDNKKNLRKAYDEFNRTLISRNRDVDVFYKELQKRGYNAIHDVNDMKYSGYNSRNPLIFFGVSDKVSVANTKKMSEKNLTRDRILANVINNNDYPLSKARNAGYIALGASIVAKNNATQSKVRSLHTSGKTNAEIAEILNISESKVSKYLNKKKK